MTTTAALSLRELLVVEDDAAIAEFRCTHTGILLWPLIRTVFLRMLLSDLHYNTPLIMGSGIARPPARRAVATLARSVLHNTLAKAKSGWHADICIMTDALGTRLVEGRWFNRLSDHFALALPDRSIVVEDHWEWNWPMPRHFPKLLFHSPWQAQCALVDRLVVHNAHREPARRLIALVAARARRHLDWDLGAQRAEVTTEMLARKLAGLPSKLRAYRAMLERIGPRVLLLNSACYGPLSPVIAAARSLGIVVAEFQHGAVSCGHDGYNIAAALRQSSAYRASLPDYFLSYGKWWSEQIDMPVGKVAIGNPHRDAQLRNVRPNPGGRVVLLLGDGIETTKYLAFAAALAAALRPRGLEVVFRPHPIERSQPCIVDHDSSQGVRLDLLPDIYESLAGAHIVISEQSSGLFEAIGYAEKIFVWDTTKSRFGFPEHPFHRVDSAPALALALERPDAGRVAEQAARDIWAPDWRKNYSAFLQSCGAAETQDPP